MISAIDCKNEFHWTNPADHSDRRWIPCAIAGESNASEFSMLKISYMHPTHGVLYRNTVARRFVRDRKPEAPTTHAGEA